MERTVTAQKKKKKRSGSKKFIDYTLLLIIVCILGFGLVMLYSTSAYNATLKYGNSIYYLKKQVIAACMGFAVMYFCIKVDYHFFARFAGIAYLAATILCLVVNFVGSSSHGSSRWLNIFGVSFQPSELAKIAVILYLAVVISKRPMAMRTFQGNVKLLVTILPIFLVVAYNNLSTAIIIAGIAFIMVFISSPKTAPFLLGVLGLAALALVFVFGTYRQERLQIWLHPEDFDKGYQTLQGLYAIGSGGLFGKGLGESIQKLGFVPEAQNDMIFSIICEELGLFGAICVILMYIMLLWRLLLIATNAKDMFGSYLVIGIMIHIALQVILNIAVVTNSMPNTGVTLPFISYGGTSIMFLIAEMGVALSVSKDAHVET
ncbi:MAG: putative peptidoglycan glycosyltransferase FtsW [Lachnospiraceae bacterium]|nr:putative peptidoglycan glycosyltransferase FtsW [Lachnospiraceae bacterium]